ncbi:MAG: ATP-grasp domain-containing protein [Gemmataceae bacterium]|nr:ATP-grasp domain-containing protein [Gemmataceae bacterium]
MMDTAETILLIGASVRAAAWSARRAGLSPWCVDLFADADLERHAPVRRMPAGQYPHGLVAAAREAPPGPFAYTGALENWPNVVEAIARDRPLWGNPPNVLRQVRDPIGLATTLQQAGVSCPLARDRFPTAEDPKRWLVKPRKSAGGAGIHFWKGGKLPQSFYLQEWVDGPSYAAVFLGLPNLAARLLGVTRQLIGEPWLCAKPFRYCGSIGPIALSAELHNQLQRLGEILTKSFGLLGLFGVDCIRCGETVWPVEVNPRYAASMEVLERATGQSFFALNKSLFQAKASEFMWGKHSCLPGRGQTGMFAPPELRAAHAVSGESTQDVIGAHGRVCGKAILFANRDMGFRSNGPWQFELERKWDNSYESDFADIPHCGALIRKGEPIFTVFAQAASEADCSKCLKNKVRKVVTTLNA